MKLLPARLAVTLLVLVFVAACEETVPPPTEIPSPEPTMAVEVAPTMPEPTMAPGEPAVCWYGSVSSLPEGSEYDDYLVLAPEEVGELGIEGADEEIEAEIAALRDVDGPGKYALFSGSVHCDVPDVGGCKLVVEELRVAEEGEPAEPLAIEGWDGTIESAEEEAGGDDYFVLSGDYPIRYGISAADEALATKIEGLRGTQIPVRITGELICGGADYNSTLIEALSVE